MGHLEGAGWVGGWGEPWMDIRLGLARRGLDKGVWF